MITIAESIGKDIHFTDSSWVDTFSEIVIISGFSIGLLHVCLSFWLRFHKFSITRVLFGHGIFIFLVACCRLCMLVSALNHKVWAPFLITWCYAWKFGEIWAVGMANTCNAIVSLAYFRLIRKAWLKDLRGYEMGKDAAAYVIFFLMLIFCTVATGLRMSYVEAFIVTKSCCLGIGANYRENELSALWLALCICIPSFVGLGCFLTGATYLALLNQRAKKSHVQLGTSGGKELIAHLKSIQAALQYTIISWVFTNSLYIFWVIYYPQSSNSLSDREFYLASAEFTTLQNLTNLIVNLHFFMLPRMGYQRGIRELLRFCYTAASNGLKGAESSLSEIRSTNVPMSKGSLHFDKCPRIGFDEEIN